MSSAEHGYHRAMADCGLDNPFWSSLRTRHRPLAMGTDAVARYPRDFAPFLGVADPANDVETALESLVASDETVLVLGVAPAWSGAWRLESLETLAQMTCDVPIPLPDGPDIIELDERHRADVLGLVALVYPHYFRPRTMELGRYFGIYQHGRLAAMIGERLGTDTHVEMSAICTHPDFTGRGYARRLTAFLTNDTLARGRTPFLHVSYANSRAKSLYERLGYRLRRDIPLWSLRRA
ncbi:MAG: Acetyltransferase [Rhodanobacteraceae bacterium]|jgi:ribosomal protein S18 acetylase RimI-like enzyme|nr:MAG: Acetyltransferase [Rhodanobacteraceae bacterium]